MADILIGNVRSSLYQSKQTEWQKWRYCYEGGQAFIDAYLEYFSERETQTDFTARKKLTYAPSFAKTEINNIRNSIYERMSDVTRTTNCDTFNSSAVGENGGVDNHGSTMNRFMGVTVLEELLPMSSVGVYVDMPNEIGDSVASQSKVKPYVYIYQIEQILSYKKGLDGEFDKLLLQHVCEDEENDYGLPSGVRTEFRLFERIDNAVKCTVYGDDSKEKENGVYYLNIPYIPFVLGDIHHSLMADIANYQIALLNIESSDLSFILSSNYPFYVEKYDARVETGLNLFQGIGPNNTTDPTGATDGSKAVVEKNGPKEIKVGAKRGRRIDKSLDYPAYVSPPTDPILASMQKQDQMKKDIKTLLNQSLSDLKGERSSAESKRQDQTGEEEGLSYIGYELNRMERKIAFFWCLYEGVKSPQITINYPESYELRSYSDRLAEAKETLTLVSQIPSETYRREMLKTVSSALLKNRISSNDLAQIGKEIDSAKAIIVVDGKTIAADVEAGICSAHLAANLKGYPADDLKLAQEELVLRTTAVALAQSKANQAANKELQADPQQAKLDKEMQRKEDPSAVRGDGQSTGAGN